MLSDPLYAEVVVITDLAGQAHGSNEILKLLETSGRPMVIAFSY